MLRQFALKNILGGLNGDPGNNERGRSREMTQTVYERMLDNRAGRLPGAAGSSYSYTDPSTRSSTEKPGQPSDMLATTPSASQILGIDRNPALAGTGARPESLAEILGLNTPSGWNNSSGWSAPGLDPKPDAQGRGAPVDTYQNLLNGIYETRPALTPQEAPRPSSPWYGGSAADTATANAMNPYATLPGSTVNPALLPPSSPRSPVPASLMPAPYNPGPPPVNNNLLLRSQGFEATRRPF